MKTEFTVYFDIDSAFAKMILGTLQNGNRADTPGSDEMDGEKPNGDSIEDAWERITGEPLRRDEAPPDEPPLPKVDEGTEYPPLVTPGRESLADFVARRVFTPPTERASPEPAWFGDEQRAAMKDWASSIQGLWCEIYNTSHVALIAQGFLPSEAEKLASEAATSMMLYQIRLGILGR